ncbi:MAG: DUF1700 domain-containing protein [Candidatus Aminicenantes bacterium]|nr:DUF1700 domain-containing protein [Candidatus Aminicenantes bacterium]
MTNNYSDSVEKIVGNYLKRLKSKLKGFPDSDREELLKEIQSHIYESYVNDPTEDEIERIFNVLDRLGEPAEVISARMPDSMVRVGKKKKLPLLILIGALIGLFGIPLGLGGIGLLFGIVITIAALVLCYYVMTFSFIIGGWLGLIAATVRLFFPDFLDRFDVVAFNMFDDPTLDGLMGIGISLGCAALGIIMLLLGRHVWRGFTFLLRYPFEKIHERRERRKLPCTAE